jgi:hypothetical protein
LHCANVSLTEELDAIDWYRQRADDAEHETLKELLLHNVGEEMEHASMLLEQIRRRGGDFERFLKTHLFTEGSILQEEKAATAEGASKAGSQTGRGGAHPQLHDRLTEGSLDDGTTSIAVSRICRTQSGERLTRLRPRLRATGLPVGGFSNCRALRHEPHLNRSRERRSLPPAVGRRSRRGQGARHFGADAAASVSSQRAADCRLSGKMVNCEVLSLLGDVAVGD